MSNFEIVGGTEHERQRKLKMMPVLTFESVLSFTFMIIPLWNSYHEVFHWLSPLVHDLKAKSPISKFGGTKCERQGKIITMSSVTLQSVMIFTFMIVLHETLDIGKNTTFLF